MEKKSKDSYVSPELEVLDVLVEAGFAASDVIPGEQGPSPF